MHFNASVQHTRRRAGLAARLSFLTLIVVLLTSLLPAVSGADEVRSDKVDPRLRQAMQANAQGSWHVIVEAVAKPQAATSNAQRAGQAIARTQKSGGRAQGPLPLIGAAIAVADTAAITRLSNDSDVAYIAYDAPVFALDTAPTSNVYEQVTRAIDVWQLGYQGKGVGVAVLDSGVNANAELTEPVSRVVARVNLVGDQAAVPDPAGHGTHVAGIIGGNGRNAPAGQSALYSGVAPQANLIDVRVLNRYGQSNVSTVIRGIEWVIAHRKDFNIRVLNVSLGAPTSAGYSYQSDPLAAALELAWRSGIVVVVAAGNGGPNPGTIQSPATDPILIAVGALDDRNTTSTSDDVLADFSARGPTSDGVSKPDLVAPGRRIIALRSPGSYLESVLPDHIVTTSNGSSYFRLSGTSTATPVVAGVAALLLEKNPKLQPDQVKYILSATARRLPAYDTNAVGSGAVDAYAAVTSDLRDRANRGIKPASAFARSVLPYLKGGPLKWRDSQAPGRQWAAINWKNIFWDGSTWDNIFWDGITWDNIFWDGITWDNIFWDGITWDNIFWDGITWDNIFWDGVTWDTSSRAGAVD